MKRGIFLMAAFLCCQYGFAQVKKSTASKPAVKPAVPFAAPAIKTSRDSASYGLGIRIAENLKAQGFDSLNQALFQRAVADVLQNRKPLIQDDAINESIGRFQQRLSSAKSSVAKAEGARFLEANSKRPGVVTLPDGLQYEVEKTGSDTTKPTLNNTVKCHYHGTLINGTVFDSSVDRGEPVSFPLNGVIKGWQEALQLMTVGSKWKLFIPSDLAYGDRQAGPSIAPGSTLIFEVELLAIEK